MEERDARRVVHRPGQAYVRESSLGDEGLEAIELPASDKDEPDLGPAHLQSLGRLEQIEGAFPLAERPERHHPDGGAVGVRPATGRSQLGDAHPVEDGVDATAGHAAQQVGQAGGLDDVNVGQVERSAHRGAHRRPRIMVQVVELTEQVEDGSGAVAAGDPDMHRVAEEAVAGRGQHVDDVHRLATADPVELDELPADELQHARARDDAVSAHEIPAERLGVDLGTQDRRDVVGEQGEPVSLGEVGGEEILRVAGHAAHRRRSRPHEHDAPGRQARNRSATSATAAMTDSTSSSVMRE